MSRHSIEALLKAGSWIRVLPAVYRLAGAQKTWFQGLVAVLLWAGEDAALSHSTSAALLELDGFHREITT